MTIYSHSRLSTFEQCRLKFKFRYIDKIKPDFTSSIEGFLGNKVHDTLEWVYNEVANGRIFDLDEIIEHFIQSWNNDFDPNTKIVKEDLSYENYFNKGIKFLIDYFLKHSPFKDNTIATEKKIFINIDEEGRYKLIGYIDRLVHDKDKNVFEIHDYKTGQIKSQEELDKDRQLALYSLAIRDLYNDVEDVHLVWHFLDHNQEMRSKRSLEELENLKNEIINLINQIESAKDYPPNTGCLCNWCEYQSNCSAFKEKEDEITRRYCLDKGGESNGSENE